MAANRHMKCYVSYILHVPRDMEYTSHKLMKKERNLQNETQYYLKIDVHHEEW